jgi:glycerol-3-phosphate dehydrogenase
MGLHEARIPNWITTYNFDLIVIGAGINGAGIARDASMRGLKTVVLEKKDIASGTTGFSTRLIHGGLRYLEYGEIDLVHESLKERARLLKIAPHLVKPIRMLIPLYERSRRKPWVIRAGLTMYDVLAMDPLFGRHQRLSREKTLRLEPYINGQGLLGAIIYKDAQAEYPERLCLENVISAVNHGAVVLTYAKVEKLLVDGKRIVGVNFRDTLSDKDHNVYGSVVINSAGPWVDDIVKTSGASDQPLIGGTKGSHIVVGRFGGGPQEAVYFEAARDGRPIFIVPWAERYLIGTTDIRFQGDLDNVVADIDEVEYLLSEVNGVFPSAHLTTKDILYTYSGVRPLPFQDDVPEASITRRHIIHDHSPEIENFISIIGGKLTTYRSLAEEAVEIIEKKLNKPNTRCTTGEVVLPGGVGYDESKLLHWLVQHYALSLDCAKRLVRIYGSRVVQIAQYIDAQEIGGRIQGLDTCVLPEEFLFVFNHESAVTLSDALLRRTMLALEEVFDDTKAHKVAKAIAPFLGWDKQRIAKEVENFMAEYQRYISFRDRAPISLGRV